MSVLAEEQVRRRVVVDGIVQGVGFRPFVHALASRLELRGFVVNDMDGVRVEVEGAASAVDEFVSALERGGPPLSVIERVVVDAISLQGDAAFVIGDSDDAGAPLALVCPDVATCDACVAELLDARDRRCRYAFTNCTNCGPRFTIVAGIPYDRARTTMASFTMCARCRAEYEDPANRRFHAEPVCCPSCGPRLRFEDPLDGPRPASSTEPAPAEDDAIAAAAAALGRGLVVAVKGLGGYHLAVDASDERAVARLRARKHREEKPFAVMVADLDAARALAEIDDDEAALLAGRRRPIVLVRRRLDSPLAPSVAPANRWLGLLLPYTPMHHLLARAFGRPFVLTSGNVSDEPIAFDDEDARRRLPAVADRFLVHDRPIRTRVDDSVTRVFRGQEMVLRRSRGYVPVPLTLPIPAARPVLACGAHLKSTFCLADGSRAFLSHHIGDLENLETYRSYTDGVAHLRHLLAIEPEVVAHDLHPDYLSTAYAHALDDVELLGVQHHHAHVASCLVDNGESGPVVGVAFDGLGFGTDGTLWGGELLVADIGDFERVGSLTPVRLPGGARAIRQPWRMAAAYLETVGHCGSPAVARRHPDEWEAITRLARSPASPVTTSAGRLFDAVAALVGIRDVATYEGQAAIELEQRVDEEEHGAYDAAVDAGSFVRIGGHELVAQAVADHAAGAPVGLIAARFHNGLAVAVARACEIIARRTGLDRVALSGGVFQNLVLLGRTVDELRAHGLRVLTHARVPPNDGGISLGQAAVAAARRGGGS